MGDLGLSRGVHSDETDHHSGIRPIQRSDDRAGLRSVGASSFRFNNLSVDRRPKKMIGFGPESVIDRRRNGDRMSPEYALGDECARREDDGCSSASDQGETRGDCHNF